MYGLKPNVDLSFLRSRELQEVAVGLYQTRFHFDEDVCVSVEGEFLYSDGQQEVSWRPDKDASIAAGRALALLGASIAAFTAAEDGTLKLEFSNGHRLTILDSSQQYESYSITRPGFNLYV